MEIIETVSLILKVMISVIAAVTFLGLCAFLIREIFRKEPTKACTCLHCLSLQFPKSKNAEKIRHETMKSAALDEWHREETRRKTGWEW